MEKQKGGIKLGLLIGFIVILLAILFLTIILTHLNNNKNDGKNINSSTSAGKNTSNNANEGENMSLDNFSLKFLKMENDNKNMIYSPLSIKYALKMLQEGAEGETKSQIEKVIGNLNLTQYKNIENRLSLANGLFIRDTYYQYVKQNYKDVLTNKYNAEVRQDNFQSANNVNKWIENKTLGIIKNMLDDGLVTNPNLEMILVNALAIDMEWKVKFSTENTTGRDFYKEDGTVVEATTMSKETSSENISYYKENEITAVSMDLEEYDNNQMEFIAIMPENNLQKYVENMTEEKVNEIANKLMPASNTSAGIIVKIPKFSYNYDLKLKEDLKSLGMTDAFDDDLADFSNMTSGTEKLYVSDALHKANIDFTEKGVKAAAVTVMALMSKGMFMEKQQPIEIDINKPFIYFIRDKKTKEIWFVGTVYEPNLWEKDKSAYQRSLY